MDTIQKCPKCKSESTYFDSNLWVCLECYNEWSIATEATTDTESNESIIKDANGTILSSGDTVILIKDLKVKGSASGIRVGTKVKNIRLLEDSMDGHNIACKIDGIGALYLKSEFVRKV